MLMIISSQHKRATVKKKKKEERKNEDMYVYFNIFDWIQHTLCVLACVVWLAGYAGLSNDTLACWEGACRNHVRLLAKAWARARLAHGFVVVFFSLTTQHNAMGICLRVRNCARTHVFRSLVNCARESGLRKTTQLACCIQCESLCVFVFVLRNSLVQVGAQANMCVQCLARFQVCVWVSERVSLWVRERISMQFPIEDLARLLARLTQLFELAFALTLAYCNCNAICFLWVNELATRKLHASRSPNLSCQNAASPKQLQANSLIHSYFAPFKQLETSVDV